MNVNGRPVVPVQPGTVAGKVLQIEGVTPMTVEGNTSATPGKEPIVKRRRQGEGGGEVDDDAMVEAASRVERRQDQ